MASGSRIGLALVCVLVVGFVACGDEGAGEEDAGGSTAQGSQVEVVTRDLAFEPASIAATGGETLRVTITNEDDVEHTFTVEDSDVDVFVAPGASEDAEITVSDAGLAFVCRIHPSMTGTIGGSDGGSDADSEGSDSLDY